MPLIYNNNTFHLNKTERGYRYWQCKMKNCKAKLTEEISTGNKAMTASHNHLLEDIDQLLIRDFDDTMKDFARRTFWTPRFIYDQAVASDERFERIPLVMPFDDHRLHFNSIARYAGERKEIPKVESFREIIRTLADGEWKDLVRLEDAKLNMVRFETDDKLVRGMLFGDVELAKNLVLAGSKKVYLINTTVVIPSLKNDRTDEMLVAIAEYRDYNFPFAWILLSESTLVSRQLAIQTFFENYNLWYGRDATFITSPKWSDLLSRRFPSVEVKLSFEMLCKEIVTLAQRDSSINLKNGADVLKIAQFASMALMHQDKIVGAYGYFLFRLFDDDEEMRQRFRLLIEFMHAQQLSKMIQGSCFEDPTMCDTVMLAYTRSLRNIHKIKEIVPQTTVDPWEFLYKRLVEIQKGFSDMKKLRLRTPLARTSKIETFTSPAKLKRIWKLNMKGEVDVANWFNDVGKEVENFIKEIIFTFPSIAGVREPFMEYDLINCSICDVGEPYKVSVPCYDLVFCIDCVNNMNTCQICDNEITEKQVIHIPPCPAGSTSKCLSCTVKPRRMMARICGHLYFCFNCCEKWTETQRTSEDTARIRLPDETQCPVCNDYSGGFIKLFSNKDDDSDND